MSRINKVAKALMNNQSFLNNYTWRDEMYNCIQLKSCITNPRINEISLELLREYYEKFLYPFEYHYTIKYAAGEYTIELRFDMENLSHLLGLESIVKYNLNRHDIKKYKGIHGWENIKNGIITIDTLKGINKKRFKSKKDKMVFFYLIPNLITSPKAIYFDNSKVNPPTNIKCEIIFFNNYDKSVLHLGIEPNSENTYYIPRTFLIERITKQNGGEKYIENQMLIDLNINKRVIML